MNDSMVASPDNRNMTRKDVNTLGLSALGGALEVECEAYLGE